MVPSVSITKCAHTPGSSPRCTEFAANVAHAPENVVPSV
jgi:hypothetical protein